jgi:AcrR family transcriptional regulator
MIRGGRPPPSRGADPTSREPTRRGAIVVSAGRLFAAKGYHGAAMREIAEAADVPLSLIVYHFETKQALYRAVFDHFHEIFEARLALLKNVSDFSAPDALRSIVEAFVRPIEQAQGSEEGRIYTLLALREASDPEQDEHGIIRDYYDPLARRFIAAMQEALPGKSRDSLVWAYLFAVSALVMRVQDPRARRLSDGESPSAGEERKFEYLINFICAGISAI